MQQTIKNVSGYNWASEDDQIWRHVRDFRLTDKYGRPHHLEITPLNSQFYLWGDLVPPKHSTCPIICVKLCVTAFALDLGRDGDDPNKGVWMSDIAQDWYKLVPPAAPEYRVLADDLFERADKFLALYDALVYQDPDEKISVYDDDTGQYVCHWTIRAVHRQAEPKFDLEFVGKHAEFVLTHLDTNFDLSASKELVDSIRALEGKLLLTFGERIVVYVVFCACFPLHPGSDGHVISQCLSMFASHHRQAFSSSEGGGRFFQQQRWRG
jgi:hypothetical protein